MNKAKLSFYDKVDEYMKEMREKQKKTLATSRFSDGPNQYNWYLRESKRLEEEYKNQEKLSKERINEVMYFSRIDQYYHDVIQPKKLSFSTKAQEYKKEVLRLKRRVRKSDNLTFSNEQPMDFWLETQNYKMYCESLDGNELTEKRKKEIELLTEINTLIDQFCTIKKLTFEQKAKEYHEKLYEIGRVITRDDLFLFSDGSPMNVWFENQLIDYRRNYKLSQQQYRCKKRFPILISIYSSIQSLMNESYDDYVEKNENLQVGLK